MRLLPLLLVVTACATGTVSTPELDYSSADIQKAIVNTLGVGLLPAEGNERIYMSNPFRVPLGKRGEAVKNDDVVRAKAKIAVVGDRRPYVIDVTVFVDEKDDEGRWSNAGKDERLARQLADHIQDYLARHKDKNFIDHFRAF
ncbi:MAG TPA: hypothetical protein VFV50_15325 [Bdellovibrionales bacterium]|nr:hypothetical protein [Bdellovibrionales bacterium]